MLADLSSSAGINDTYAVASVALSISDQLNERSAVDSTDVAARIALRSGAMRLIEQTASNARGARRIRTAPQAAQLAKVVAAILSVPVEATSATLAAGSRLIRLAVEVVTSRHLPLLDAELQSFGLALETALRAAASRLHPQADNDDARLRRRRRRAQSSESDELGSGDVTEGAAEGAAEGADPVPAGYASFAPIAHELLHSARLLALDAMRVGVPPQHLPWSSQLEARTLAVSPDGLGAHALWNISCDPLFRQAAYGASDDTLQLTIPTGGGALSFRLADLCDQGGDGGGSAAPILLADGETFAQRAAAQPLPQQQQRPAVPSSQQPPPVVVPDPRWSTADIALISMDADPHAAASRRWEVETSVLALAARRSDELGAGRVLPTLYDSLLVLPLIPFDVGRRTDHLVEDKYGEFAPEALYAGNPASLSRSSRAEFTDSAH